MTLTLTSTTETYLNELAARRGQAPEEIINALIEREAAEERPPAYGSIASPTLSPTAALFKQWAEEDVTDDPEEIRRRQQEGDELLENLRNNHLSLHHVDVSGEEWD